MELYRSNWRCIWRCTGDVDIGLLIWGRLDGVERYFETLEILEGDCAVGAFG